VEGSTSDLDVVRTPSPSSWRALVDMVTEFARDHHGRKALVIDTVDWAEKLCVAHVCAANNITSLGGQEDYGRSYNLLEVEWYRFLDALSRVAASGMHVCLLAHAKMRKFEVPDEKGSFDRFELKLERKTSAALKEWARTVLFLNYKTYVVTGEKKGDKPRGTGGHRVMYSSHHPIWDAKNRAGLPEEMRVEYKAIESLFASTNGQPAAATSQTQRPSAPITEPAAAPHPQSPTVTKPEGRPSFITPLLELTRRDSVSEREVQLAVAKRGYYPADTPLENYDPQFVAGKLVAYWPRSSSGLRLSDRRWQHERRSNSRLG